MPDIDAKKIEELLPCPFCGGAAQAEHFESKLGRWCWSIGCNDHTSEADDGGEPAAECYGFQSMTSFATKAEAIAAWNRRASHSLASASGGEDAELCKRLEIKADMIQLGEGIAWGSDSEIMREAAARIRTLSAQLAEARREGDLYRRAYGCLSCGECHPPESMCPPHEVRSSGIGSHRQQIGKAVARATASEAQAAALRERVWVLEKALEPFAEAATKGEIGGYPPNYFVGATEFENARRARTALDGRE